jgi:hypothetical protein
MPYGPYNYGPEVIEKGKQKAMDLAAPAVNAIKRQQSLAQDNNPSPITRSQGGPSRTRAAIDSGARSTIGGIRENIGPALKQGYAGAVDFTSRNVIEPIATAKNPNSGSTFQRKGAGGPNGGVNPPSITDGYQVVDESPRQVAVQRGPGLDPIFRGSVGQPGDAANSLAQGRGANAARQSTIDADVNRLATGRARIQQMADDANRGQPSRFDEVVNQQLENIDDLQNGTYNNRDGQRLFRATQALGGVADNLTSRENTGERTATTRYAADVGAVRNANDNVLLADRNRISQQRADDTARFQQAAAQARASGDSTKFLGDIATQFSELQTQGFAPGSPEFNALANTLQGVVEGTEFEASYDNMLNNMLDGLEGNFNGGLVEQYAQGGPVLPQAIPSEPAGPNPQLMNQYQQYAVSAQEMGLTAIPFEKFAGLQGSSGQTIENFEDGGAIPGQPSGGRMVIDSDPNAPADSIPAEIDGARPAALDSGEFIFPTDVVLYFGTDKLNKMIEKARDTGEETNGPEQSTAFQLGAQ